MSCNVVVTLKKDGYNDATKFITANPGYTHNVEMLLSSTSANGILINSDYDISGIWFQNQSGTVAKTIGWARGVPIVPPFSDRWMMYLSYTDTSFRQTGFCVDWVVGEYKVINALPSKIDFPQYPNYIKNWKYIVLPNGNMSDEALTPEIAYELLTTGLAIDGTPWSTHWPDLTFTYDPDPTGKYWYSHHAFTPGYIVFSRVRDSDMSHSSSASNMHATILVDQYYDFTTQTWKINRSDDEKGLIHHELVHTNNIFDTDSCPEIKNDFCYWLRNGPYKNHPYVVQWMNEHPNCESQLCQPEYVPGICYTVDMDGFVVLWDIHTKLCNQIRMTYPEYI